MEKVEIKIFNIIKLFYSFRVINIYLLIYCAVYKGIYYIILFSFKFKASGKSYKNFEYINS